MDTHSIAPKAPCRLDRLPGSRTLVMGILNVTPDSFSDGGLYLEPGAAVEHGLEMAAAGADMLDIGGESTRPGSDPVPEADELRRVIPVIEALRRHTDVAISIDTTSSTVAEQALATGADLVNDISGLRFDPRIADVAAEAGAGLVLMHSRQEPKTMQRDPVYSDVVEEVRRELAAAVRIARERGVSSRRIIIDPGLGFAKTARHNLLLLQQLHRLTEMGFPVLVGPSRKSFIGAVLEVPVEGRLTGTIAAVAVAVLNGASIVRVHDVQPAVQAVRMVDAVTQAEHHG